MPTAETIGIVDAENVSFRFGEMEKAKKMEIDECWSCARGCARTVIPVDVLHMLFYFRFDAINMHCILDIITYTYE